MFDKLNRETLAQQVAQSLIAFIERQELKPGDTLPSEIKLATEFGVSRPIIREALKSLEGRGIIDILNGKSATIKPISSEILSVFFQRALHLRRETFLELIEVRRGIEIQCAMLAAQRRKPDELARMKTTVARMRQNMHDPDAYADLDVELHLLIASATHNSMMYHLVKSIRDSLKDTILEGLRHRFTDEEFESVQARHDELVTELERGDPERAGRAMALHFDVAVKLISDGDPPAN